MHSWQHVNLLGHRKARHVCHMEPRLILNMLSYSSHDYESTEINARWLHLSCTTLNKCAHFPEDGFTDSRNETMTRPVVHDKTLTVITWVYNIWLTWNYRWLSTYSREMRKRMVNLSRYSNSRKSRSMPGSTSSVKNPQLFALRREEESSADCSQLPIGRPIDSTHYRQTWILLFTSQNFELSMNTD